MKKRFLSIIISIFVCGILGALAETFIFNLKSLTLSEADYSVSDIPYTTEKTDDGKTKLTLDIDEKYIRELIIDYSTPSDIDYAIEYTYVGIYGQDADKTFNDIFEDMFTVAATNINATVKKLSILFDKKSEVKINQINIDNNFHFNYFRASFISLALITICALFFFYKNGFKTEKIHIYFAVIATLLGLMFIVSERAMVFTSWDDQTHFDRTVSLLNRGKNFTNGEFYMSDGNHSIAHSWSKSTNSYTEHRIRSSHLDIEAYADYTGGENKTYVAANKLPYLPMSIGYHAAKLINLPFTICFYVGKIFNLILYVLLMTYAIKTLIIGKRLLAIIALLPSNLFLASNYSLDPAVFTGITIFIVHIINLWLSKDKATKFDFKTALIMISSMAYACLAKSAYAPIMLLSLLIPKDKFKNARQSHLIKTGLIAITILLGSVLLLPALDGAGNGDARGGNVSVKDQTLLVVSHPFDYATVLGDTAVEEFSYRLFGAATLNNFSYTYHSDERSNFFYILIILLIFVFLTDNEKNTLNKKQRLGLLGISILIIVIIWSALYLDFTPIGLNTINGIQSRYFLPLLLPLLLSLQIPGIQNKIDPKYYNLIIFAIISAVSIFMVYNFILVPYNF